MFFINEFSFEKEVHERKHMLEQIAFLFFIMSFNFPIAIRFP